MLSGIEISLEKSKELSYNSGSVFHGYIMENIESEFANRLHEQGLKPYSQYIFEAKDKKYLNWRILTCNEECREKIIDKIANGLGNEIYLNNRGKSFKVCMIKHLKSTTYKEFIDKIFINDGIQDRVFGLEFLTPTSFKSNGDNQIFPSTSFILKSLFGKWNSFAGKYSFEDDEVLEHLLKTVKIIGYNLKSTFYHVERVKVNSFIGKVNIKVTGVETMMRIAKILLYFGEYSGIGAKTSLGMGGVMINKDSIFI